MFFKQGKIVITLFMLLTFIGQALAYNVVPCTMHDPAPQMSADFSVSFDEAVSLQTGHKQNMASHSHESMAQENCENTCCCPMGSCVSLALTSVESNIDELLFGSHKINQRKNLMLSRYPASLYRPPIPSK